MKTREFAPRDTRMLCVCAWCRRVRNDRGIWETFERQGKETAGTVVSHGICPACARKVIGGNA